MEVNDALIKSLSDLACLEFDAAEKDEIQEDLRRMIAFVEKLNGLDTRGTEPLQYMGDEVDVLREDIVQGSSDRADILLNAPSSDGTYFKVPRVIKHPTTDQ